MFRQMNVDPNLYYRRFEGYCEIKYLFLEI